MVSAVFDLGFERAGIHTLWQVECDPYCLKVLEKHWPNVRRFYDIRDLISGIKNGIIVVCNEDVTASVQSVPSVPKHQGDRTVSPAIRSVPFAGAMQTENVTEPYNALGARERSQKHLPNMEGGASAVGLPNPPFLHSITSTMMDTKNAQSTILKSGKSSGNAPAHPDTKSFAITATTPNQEVELVRIRRPDIISGGVPCQPASVAGKRRGRADDRWLWGEALEVVRLIQPTWCVFENVYGLLNLEGGMAFESLCVDLESTGYEVQTFCLPACAVDAPHRRERLWIVGSHPQRPIGKLGQTTL